MNGYFLGIGMILLFSACGNSSQQKQAKLLQR